MGAHTSLGARALGFAFALACAALPWPALGTGPFPPEDRTAAAASKPSPTVVLWFNAVVRVTGAPAGQPVTLCITRQELSWKDGRHRMTVEVPDAVVSFKPWESTAWTVFGNEYWDTSVPIGALDDDVFLAGVAVPLAVDAVKKIRNLGWSARFESDTPGVSVRWRWSVASYKLFTDDYDALGVVPLDESKHGDLAGTPRAMKPFALLAGLDDNLPRALGKLLYTGLRGPLARARLEPRTSCGGMY